MNDKVTTHSLAHQPVLLDKAIEGLAIRPGGIYVDATFGRGGHAKAILAQLDPRGRLLVIDKDPEAVTVAKQLFASDRRVVVAHASFATLRQLVDGYGWMGKVNGILFDLGVSSPQLADPARGFSFMRNGPLDMRMNTTVGISAATWLNTVDQSEIAAVLKDYGEERHARRIAAKLVQAREEEAILTTGHLAELIAAVSPTREKGKHPATRSFQAIRIFINQELDDLKVGLEQCVDVLAVGGRLVVISFHSLEDRIVKRFIRRHVQGERLPIEIPIIQPQKQRLLNVGRPVKPTTSEVKLNPRARSAVLRIAEKLL